MSVLEFDNYPTVTLSRPQINAYRNLHTTRLNQTHTRTFIPRYLEQTSFIDITGVAAYTYKGVTGGWKETMIPPTSFNLYYYVDPMNTDTPTNDLTWSLQMTAHIECKNVR